MTPLLAHRLDALHLAVRRPRRDLVKVAGAVGLQDTPPGSAALALAARVDGLAPGDLDAAFEHGTLVRAWSVREAPRVLPAKLLPEFTRALLPRDDADARAGLKEAMTWVGRSGIAPLEAQRLVEREMRSVLAKGPLPKWDVSLALAARAPAGLLRPCASCGADHLPETLFRRAAHGGGVLLARDSDAGPVLVHTEDVLGTAPPQATPTARLAKRFVEAYGLHDAASFAAWSGLSRPQAEAALARVRAPRLHEAAMEGARFLPPHDPLLESPDREQVAPREADRKVLWRALGSPGALLLDGAVAGAWRAQRKGKRLLVTIQPFRRLAKDEQAAARREAATLAPWKGAESAEVTFA